MNMEGITRTEGNKAITDFIKDGVVTTRTIKTYVESVDEVYTTETWTLDGKRHREDGPAIIDCANGQLTGQRWYRYGLLHREDGPARVEYLDGVIVQEIWYAGGIIHNDNGPAEVYYSQNGEPRRRIWRINGKLGGNVLAYGWLVSADIFRRRCVFSIDSKAITNIDRFRDAVKSPLVLELMRPLPIPIRQAIYEHYCMQ